MLDFFRKYQQSFFLVITILVISSFVFFGTYNAMVGTPEREDRVVGKAIDGSEMSQNELADLARFLAVDREDIGLAGAHVPPNLLNDGVIRNDLLKTGIADTVIQITWDFLKGGFDEKVERAKRYHSYEHPDAPFLSAKAVWERFLPAVNREWAELQAMNEINVDAFTHLSRLYFLQSRVPPEWMRNILLMSEKQYSWLKPDPRLRQEDLSLFGFHTVSDWFGKDFLDLMAQFIHNAAIEAEEKGYVVTLEEAKADLKKNYLESMTKLQEAKIPITLTYKDQLRTLGLDETQAARLWQKVLLFRRHYTDLGEAAFVDRLPYTEFNTVATEKAVIDLYQWPHSLRLTTAVDLLGFQTYLKSVAVIAKDDPLALPTAYLSAEEAIKKNPELVATHYSAEIAAVDKRETALKAPLTEVWNYETSDEAWKQLRKEFPFVAQLTGTTPEERFKALETLDPVNRGKIDLFARRKLLNSHPEWVAEALEKAPKEEKQLVLSAGAIQLPHVDHPKRLGALFEQILTQPEQALTQLSQFDSGEAVFRFDNIAKLSDPKIKTYEEAKKDGSLARITDKLIETEYAKHKDKLAADKQSLPWSDVKEEIAELMLSDLKKQIVKGAPKEEVSFASLRFLKPATAALEAIKTGEMSWLKQEGEDPLVSQFKLEKVEKEIPRTAQEDWMTKEPFILLPKEWSAVHVAPDGSVDFFYLKERKAAPESILDPLSFGKQMLVSDVQRILAEQLLNKMMTKNVIVIPVQPEQK